MSVMTIGHGMSAEPPDLAEFESLEARLILEFSPPLRPEEVQRCLFRCITQYQFATVRNYMSVLIEGDVREQLRAFTRDRTR